MLKCCRSAMSELKDMPLVKQTIKSAPCWVIFLESRGYMSSQHSNAPTDTPSTSPTGEASKPRDSNNPSSAPSSSQSFSQGNISANGTYSPPAISSILSCRPSNCSCGSKRNAETYFSFIFGLTGKPYFLAVAASSGGIAFGVHEYPPPSK